MVVPSKLITVFGCLHSDLSKLELARVIAFVLYRVMRIRPALVNIWICTFGKENSISSS